MANVYFIPRLDEGNNIDFLEAELQDVAKMVPLNSTLYYIPSEAPNEAEIRYKAQFILAPRIIVFEKSGVIPKESLMLSILDKSISPPKIKNDTLLKHADQLFSASDRFNVTLLKKK